jgi:four helix bundle protein
MTIKTFREIVAWQKSHELVLLVYVLTAKYPKHELFGLTSQSRRCSVSIPSNIAEGFKRKSKNDSLHFYNMAEASLEELKYQLLLAKDLKYITEVEYQKVFNLSEDVGRLINGWIKVQK